MTFRHMLPRLALAVFCAVGAQVQAADEPNAPSVTLDRPGVGNHEIKQGDKVPDEYKRKELALGDWKQRHLNAPGENEQWVEIKDKYVLVNIPNGTAKSMVDKKGHP